MTWQRIYELRLIALDFFIVIGSLAGAQLWVAATGRAVIAPEGLRLPFVLVMALAWVVVISALGARNSSVFGAGVDEYRRIAVASLVWLGTAALLAVMSDTDLSATFLLIAWAAGLIGLIVGRWLLRRWLVARRRAGQYCARVAVQGGSREVERVLSQLGYARDHGFLVLGVIADPNDIPPTAAVDVRIAVSDDPVVGMRELGADTLVLAGGASTTPDVIKQIGWRLDGTRENLILAEALVDVAGPRVEMTYVPNLTLVRVAAPTYGRASRFSKRILDLAVAGLALALLSPLFVIIAVAIKRSSPGPVFFHQSRVGYRGQLFRMHKFRSMVVDAEDLRIGLLDDPTRNTNEVLFKLRLDPRVTPIGRWLRRFSLDELPQLMNVIRGDMSLVGPRPPLPEEVLKYEDEVKRRFLVKPGLTGLWQISGRSDLSWSESVRFDLYYVENWSLVQDLQIIWRTVGVVLFGRGAY